MYFVRHLRENAPERGARVSVTTLAKESGWSESVVKRVMKKLERLQILQIKGEDRRTIVKGIEARKGGAGSTPWRTVNFNGIPQTPSNGIPQTPLKTENGVQPTENGVAQAENGVCVTPEQEVHQDIQQRESESSPLSLSQRWIARLELVRSELSGGPILLNKDQATWLEVALAKHGVHVMFWSYTRFVRDYREYYVKRGWPFQLFIDDFEQHYADVAGRALSPEEIKAYPWTDHLRDGSYKTGKEKTNEAEGR